jgi:peptide-methionine (R)-S-oxide reductase
MLQYLLLAAVLLPMKTERAFSCPWLYETAEGTYCCAGCKAPLFSSQNKYDAGAGWPCFTGAIEKSVYFLEDWSLPFKRYEVVCKRCDTRLGHIFKDGPPPRCTRYCIPSVNLIFSSEIILKSSINIED